jgi:hypothetical protein
LYKEDLKQPLSTTSINGPIKLSLNVEGPNPYYLFARFLLLVDKIESLEHTIGKEFKAIITKKKDKDLLLEDEDDESY